jgi:hypothetical protein
MISPIGEPGSGKSTFSLGLAHVLKQAGVRAEFVPEVVKHDVFTQEGVNRVTSGRFDSRYLRLQHAATKGFLEQAEVVVNDGALEPFYYYGKGRISEKRWAGYEALLERFRVEQAMADHRFVTLDMQLDYDPEGRHQDHSTALAMRAPLLDELNRRYGIEPVVLRNEEDMRAYALCLAQEVLENRPLHKLRSPRP